ncbi:DUF3253 domain-containing protein [Limnobacter humi]|uniref:DUF3253 domain-containing protein n=1 Tax=Limnobacter humi TaxID=1778671 RepID=A0ABT1WJC8_9BURK|nr:DUF3253 domain-containing protein [Limnobacter humi]
MNPTQTDLPEAILSVLAQRRAGGSICPSEVARQVGGANWRNWMEPVRQAARKLAQDGRLRVTQKDATLSPTEPWQGAIRFRLPG